MIGLMKLDLGAGALSLARPALCRICSYCLCVFVNKNNLEQQRV